MINWSVELTRTTSEKGNTDEVVSVVLNGTNSETGLSRIYKHDFTQRPNTDSYIAFEDLTDEDIVGWVLQQIKQEDVDKVEHITSQIPVQHPDGTTAEIIPPNPE